MALILGSAGYGVHSGVGIPYSSVDTTILLFPCQLKPKMKNGESLGNEDYGLPSLLSLSLSCQPSALLSI